MPSDCNSERWYEGILCHHLIIIVICKLILALKQWKGFFFQLFAPAHENILILPEWGRKWLYSEITSYSMPIFGPSGFSELYCFLAHHMHELHGTKMRLVTGTFIDLWQYICVQPVSIIVKSWHLIILVLRIIIDLWRSHFSFLLLK